MMKTQSKKSLIYFALGLSITMVGCGGSDNDSSPEPVPTPVVLSGVFSDSPVSGLGFETASQSGVTDAEGQFDYLQGEEVVFFLGGTRFPSVTAQEEVTPMDLYQTDSASDTGVVNTLRILQSLDQDHDAENGIQLADEINEILAGTQMDPQDPLFDQQATAALVVAGMSADDLVDSNEALAHFGQGRPYQLADLTGRWHSVFFSIPVMGTASQNSLSYTVESWDVTEQASITSTALIKNPGRELDTETYGISMDERGMITLIDEGVAGLDMGLSANKDIIANYFADDDGLEQELGLAIKLSNGHSVSDLEGQWHNLSIETPVADNFNPSEFGVWADSMQIDAQGHAVIHEMALPNQQAQTETEELTFSLNDAGKVTFEGDDETSLMYISRSNDVIVRHGHKAGRASLVVMLKSSLTPSLADLQGEWRLYNLQVPNEGDMDPADFGYWIVNLSFDDKGNATWSHVATSEGASLTDQSMTMSLNNGLFTGDEDLWAMNQAKDLMVVTSIYDGKAAYAIAIKQVR
ncbi:hypothetical protein EKG38_13510 [Shewanella canadensis]|uniref:Uncharacterized protein n=1 Tax=Shewanella canadensis TaxID=271096 RepID=A0A431WTT3_9GAMM|nr:hypothetical protein [Shewanella canadensis]RTR38524.1 hypothetical protein EKG38_13510 [Shewanella canadensis]